MEQVIGSVARRYDPKLDGTQHDDDFEHRLRQIRHQINMNFDLILAVLTVRGQQHSSEEVQTELTRVRHLIRVIAELQEGPGGSDEVDFAAYLDRAANLWNRLAWEIDVEILNVRIEPLRLDGTIATTLAVVVFETLSNSIEHAYPSHRRGREGRIAISLERDSPEHAKIRIEDDGVGFRAVHRDGKDGGVPIAKAMIGSLGGSMGVTSEPGRGTKVTIGFPIPRTKNCQPEKRP